MRKRTVAEQGCDWCLWVIVYALGLGVLSGFIAATAQALIRTD